MLDHLKAHKTTHGEAIEISPLDSFEVQQDPKKLFNKQDILNDIKPVRLTILEYGWLLNGNAGD